MFAILAVERLRSASKKGNVLTQKLFVVEPLVGEIAV